MAETIKIKAYVTAAPDESKYIKAATKREWEAMPTVKAYVTAEPNAEAYIKGNTMRVIGGTVEETSQTYPFEQLQGVTARYNFEPLTASLDIDNTYLMEITVNAPPTPPTPAPDPREPIIYNSKYGMEMNPYFTPGRIGHTLYLSDVWDIMSDDVGRIATVSGAYAIAQNAANAVRLFTNDAWLARKKGIPHFDVEIGKAPGIAAPILRTRVIETVNAVEGITDSGIKLSFDTAGRVLGGEIQATIAESINIKIEI